MRRAALVLAALVLAACSSGGGGQLKVSAAASLQRAFSAYDPHASYSFAGSDQLAAQIRAGARPDVYAAANTALPQSLYRARLVQRPVIFARNRLVLATSSRRVRSLADAARPGVTIAMGSPTVPVGAYARRVIAATPFAKRIVANVRSEEPDVAGVVGKLEQGAVDAGFVYATDARAAGLRAIPLPHALVSYGAAVVRPGAAAERFVRGLLSGRGRQVLLRAGFLPPP